MAEEAILHLRILIKADGRNEVATDDLPCLLPVECVSGAVLEQVERDLDDALHRKRYRCLALLEVHG